MCSAETSLYPASWLQATAMPFDAVAASRMTEGGAAAVKCLFRC